MIKHEQILKLLSTQLLKTAKGNSDYYQVISL